VPLLYRPNHPQASENGMVDASIAGDRNSKDPRFYVISDTMPMTRHMATGEYFSSKSEFRKATKAAGCIEVGNDSSVMNPKKRNRIPLDRGKRREDIRRTIYELRNGIRRND
jgi:hypothetical protein